MSGTPETKCLSAASREGCWPRTQIGTGAPRTPQGQREGLLSPCTCFLTFKTTDSGLLPSAEKSERNVRSEATPRPRPPSPGKACDHGLQHQLSRTLVTTQDFPGPLHTGERENPISPSVPTGLLPQGSTILHRETEGKSPSQCHRRKATLCPC